MCFCNHCGKPVSEGNQFCDYCGAELRAGSNTVPGGSPFRPAGDFDTQYAPASQPGDNGFSAPGNIGAPEGSFHKLRLPSQWSEPSTASEARVPANRTFSDLKFGRNSQHNPDPTPAKKKSPLNKIIAASAAILAATACVAAALIFLFPKTPSEPENGTLQTFENGDYIFTPDKRYIAYDESEATIYFNNQLVVYTFSDLNEKQAQQLAQSVGGDIVGEISGAINALQIAVPESTLAELNAMSETLMQSEDVLYAGYDYPMEEDVAETDPWSADPKKPDKDLGNENKPTGNDWAQEAIGAYTAWEYSQKCKPINIGIQDNGFISTHADLSGKLTIIEEGTGENDDIYTDHGTKVAGIIGATANNGIGIRGIAENAHLYCTASDGYSSSLLSAKQLESMLKEYDVKVINRSIGEPCIVTLGNFSDWNLIDGIVNKIIGTYDAYLEYCNVHARRTGLDAMNQIVECILNDCKDFIIVQCAGNGYDNGGMGYDAKLLGTFCAIDDELFNSYSNEIRERLAKCGITYKSIKDHILVVGAVKNKKIGSEDYKMTSFSNYGKTVDICAPGVDGFSTAADGGYGEFSGTSMAAPLVAGSVAYIWSLRPELSAEKVRDIILTSTTHKAHGVGDDAGSTYPMLNLGQAVNKVLEPTEQEILDAYIEACHFYGSWFYSGYANSGWLTESQKYVETYENGNVSVDNFDDYYNKHCRARDHEITTVAQLKDRLYNYFLPDFADTLLENADPIESEGKLFTYAPGPFVPMCTGVEKLESIEKTGEHTWLLTVSGHTQWDENEPIYGRVLCEYKDGKCLFSTYDEENRDYLIGNSVFDLIAELSLPSENAHNNQDIPSDAVQFNGHYYYLYDFTGLAPAEKNTWENALAYCQGVNGYLATITSPEENEFVYNYMKKRGYASAYFGLTDNGTEGTWTWCNGEALNYTNWASGEPNGGTGENYALFYYKYSDGTWNDGDFVDRATRSGEGPAFICEWGEYEVGGQETTEPTNPPGAPESGGNATGMSYEEARSIYLDYFRNIDLESLRVPFSPYTDETVQVFDFAHCSKEDYTIQSMLADIGNDGSYELLLVVGNPKFMGPAGYPICSLLFAIHDGKVEQVLDSYFTGGTAGGGTLSVVFDTVTERHLVATNSHGRDGIWYGLSTFTVFDCRDQSFAEAGMLTSAAISLDSQYYQSKADQIRAADPYAIEEDGYLKYFLLDDVYISKSEYEAQRNRYTEPTDASFILKDATFENLIP